MINMSHLLKSFPSLNRRRPDRETKIDHIIPLCVADNEEKIIEMKLKEKF